MRSAIDTVRAFYAALGQGDAPAALGLMADLSPAISAIFN
jgi:ketosteroid isomerase-like protein